MKPDDYFRQQSSTHITYGKVLDLLKNGYYKVKQVTICDGTTYRAKIDTTTGWYPLPEKVSACDIPINILTKINKGL
jgi:hypothetical protein